jgi:hypothetical protein
MSIVVNPFFPILAKKTIFMAKRAISPLFMGGVFQKSNILSVPINQTGGSC